LRKFTAIAGFALAILAQPGPVGIGWAADGAHDQDAERLAKTEALVRRHVDALAVDIGERPLAAPLRLARAAAYIRREYRDMALHVSEQAYAFAGVPVANVVATPAGQAGATAYFVVGAHYDSIPGSPGADDNASGVAVLLATASRIAADPPPVAVKFVAFTLEELPAGGTAGQGSRVFVREAREAGHRVLGAIILEMVGFTGPRQRYPIPLERFGYPREGNFIAIIGSWGGITFWRAVRRAFRGNRALPTESLFVPFRGWVLHDTRRSDNAPFWDAGWPAVMVTDTSEFRNPNYHGAGDTAETLDYPFMTRLVDSVEAAVRRVAAAPR